MWAQSLALTQVTMLPEFRLELEHVKGLEMSLALAASERAKALEQLVAAQGREWPSVRRQQEQSDRKP